MKRDEGTMMRRTLLVAAVAMMTALAACGGGSDSASKSTAAVQPPEVPADSAPEPAGVGALPFEPVFEACLDAAGIASTNEIASILRPPDGVLLPDTVSAPAEPIAAYGPTGEAWWGVLVAESPQDRYFLTHKMPTNTSYSVRGRVVYLRGALSGWTDDATIVAADLPAEQQAQLEPISACVLSALESDDAHRAQISTADTGATVGLVGELTGIECDGPQCSIVANETLFTVPADGSAGALSGTATYTVAAPSANGSPNCAFTITRTFTYEGTVDETPPGTTVSTALFGFRDALSSAATGPDDPAWPGRVLARGTLDLVGSATPEGCADATAVPGVPTTFVGYYAPAEQILSGTWTQGPDNPEYLWAIGEM